MTTDEFGELTVSLLPEEGLEEHLPTAVYPERKHVAVLEGALTGSDLETVALEWAAKGAVGDEEFLVAFKVSPTEFKVIRRHAGEEEQQIFEVAEGGPGKT